MVTKREVGKLYIKKRSLPEWMTLYIFVFPFIISFLIGMLKLPSLFKYTVDAVWLIMMVLIFARRNIVIKRKLKPIVSFAGIFLLYTLITYIFHFQSPFYYLWGFRNNFRYYAAFIAFVTFLNEEDGKSCFKFIDILFWINISVSLYQFFVMGLEQDYLGGIFGIERGCNSYSILLFAIVLSKSLLLYMEGKEGAVSCFAKCGCALVLAAMAELKLFFLIFVFILVFSSILTRFSVRKFVMLFVSALLLFVASSVLTSVFGMAQELSFDRIVQLVTATNYASAEDLGRFTALPTISKTILTDVSDKIFGMGLGNCDTSAFAICNTPFFETHQKLHYTWFSSAFLFLETGYIGLTLNLTFYVICCLISFKLFKNGKSDRLFCQLGMIVSLLAIIMVFYNSSLRTEAGYMVYFVLSLPLVASREWSGAAISEKTIKN